MMVETLLAEGNLYIFRIGYTFFENLIVPPLLKIFLDLNIFLTKHVC